MQLFTSIYNWMIERAKRPSAPYLLYTLSFAESSVFPVPPDVMLIPMSLAMPERAFRYALFTTCASVLGGILGYCLGMFFFSLVHPYIVQWGYEPTYLSIAHKMDIWGFWVLFLLGWGPVPYKLVTISAGALGMPWGAFILGSFLGRGGRFFLVASLMQWGGARLESFLRQYIERAGWIFLCAIASVITILRLKSYL